jgi:hypothetical protein
MRSVLLAAFCTLSFPALAECQYRTVYNYVTGAYEDAPIACSREPMPDRTRIRAQSWRECPVHEETDPTTGRSYTVRVCKTDAFGS